MNIEQKHNELLINYLLGNLSERDRDEVENKYFLEDDWLFSLLEIEDQLIRDYANNRLSGKIRNRFETTYLATDAGRAKLDHYLQLERIENSAPATVWKPGPEELAGVHAAPARHFREYRSLFFAGAAALLLLIGGVWLYRSVGNDPASVASVRPGQSAAQVGENVVSAVLRDSEEIHRGELTHAESNTNPAVITTPETRFLELKLKLRPPPYAQYRGRLLDKNQHFAEVAHNGQLTPVESPDMRYVLWKLGTDEVPIGDYQVELQGFSASGVKGETSHYDFKHRGQ